MSTFLETIRATKVAEVEDLKSRRAWSELEASAMAAPPALSFCDAIVSSNGELTVIAEIKRRSPSRDWLAADLNAAEAACDYAAGGAAALSILTDHKHFAGTLDDLTAARSIADVPILRKDFIIDEAQVFEAREYGADAILLIVAMLEEDTARLRSLRQVVEDLGMTALVEVHNDRDLELALEVGAKAIGVNRRDFRSPEFPRREVLHAEAHDDLAHRLPAGIASVAMSGLKGRRDAEGIALAGFDSVLVGEYVVTARDRKAAVQELVGVRIGAGARRS